MTTGWKVKAIVVLALQCLNWSFTLSQPAEILQVIDDGLEELTAIPTTDDCHDVCVASGDPHIKTFDCVRYEYHGQCDYTLVKNCGGDLPTFEIIGEFHRQRFHKKLSVIQKLLITCEGTDIELDTDFNVRINGAVLTNVNQAVSFGNIYRFRNAVKVTLDIGITIYWSSPYRVMIRIEPAAAELLNGNLCGLCGNANDIMYDDFTTRDGKLVSDVVVLGDNWRTDEDCGLCHDCVNTICTTNQHNEQQAEELVGNFIDDTAPDCGDNNVEALTQQIKDLLCATLPEVDGACQLVDNYVDVCEENDIPIQKPVNEMCNPGCEVDGVSLPFGSTWINGDCTQECNCGKEMGLQCTDMQCDENASCTPDEEGPSSSCRCNAPDFVGDGIECSPFDPCKPSRCQNDGQCFGVGNQFACICINDFWGPLCQNPPPCSSNPCQNGGTCVNDGGNYRCLCPFGVWGGPTCTIRCYVCWACGDPHYYTLDGQWYDFQGKCMYTLAKSSPDFPNQFEVVGNNIEAYWNSKVSITRQVYVFLDFGADGWFSFCFRYGYFGILVNEAAVSLPYRNFDDNGRVRVDIRQAGSYTLLSTNFGMYVVWNGVHCVCIVVPEYFMNNVYGLCGYFSGDTADDWTKPDNELATSANEFGNSWVYEEVESCQEPCTDDTCIQGDPCVENDREGLANQLCLYLNIDANTGPFVNCFGTINPGQYYANCKYDICAGQNMEAICDDVENYVFDCRAAEITIPANWRDMLPACAIICDETTEEYLECGTGCPATCANPAAPQTCTLQCLAGCQCRAGLLWTPDGCVSPDQCGCTLNGVYYAPNEEFVRDDCSEKCTCRIGGQVECVEYGPCHENAECTVRNGQRGCYCQNGYYGDGFNCVAWYTCGACGDPHYKSFDGVRFDFQGKCTYTLVKTVSGDINFEVIAKNVEWSYNPLTTLTRQLFINVFDQSVWFRHDTTAVYVNDEVVNLPYVLNRQLIVYRVWIYTVLITDFGLQVIWDGNTCVTIRLPDTFMQKVLGLCGFFNGDPSDDFKNLDLTLINTVNGFGNSWEYGNDENCVSCTPEICPEGDPCVDNPGGDDVCAPFKDNGSPFAVCFQEVDPDPFFTDCSYDACSAQTNEPNVCEYFERYVGVCREAGVAINGWRKVHTECAIECRDRMKYTDCGTPCPATCANPNSPNECEQQTCVQGCQCIPGLVLSGDECVEPNQCGCQYNGRYYMPMETFVTSDCGLRCQCVGNNQVSCQPFGCGNNAVCNVRDWVRGCYCQDNYVMLADGRNCEPTSPCDPNPCENGGECIESADRTSYVCNCPYGQWAGPTCNIRCYLCYACGDPHYKTFDGRYYDYQGKCQYTLVKSLSDAPNEFEVVANNIEWAYYPTVSITRAIYVMITVGGKDNVFSFESSSSVRVNDIAVNIPYYLLNEDGSTHLVVRKFGYYTVLWTEFGLIVEWNGYSCVRLYLPESYKTYVAGLCGLFNGDSSDDFTDPDHTLLPDTNSFGNSWVHGQCENPCTPETCPVDPCEGNAEATMEAELLCRELKADNQFSPFKDCFDDVDPDQYFHNCKFDKCIDPDRSDTLCEAFNLYVTACRDAGISIGNWRASVEACTTECGENMEYQFCGTACPATCSEGAAEAICNTQCVESCQCVTGYVWNNEECVPQDECGCTDKGRYYEVGQTVVSDDCKTECTCEAGGNLQCEQVRDKCNENEVCEIRNGKRGCFCPYGFFYSNEGICQPRFTCVACGDPHYVTWEGKRYDYMGRCSYILAKSHDSAPNSFMIVGDNIPWERNPRATVTRYVYTYAYGLTVKFSWDTKAVLVDDEAVNLPFYFEDHLVVYSSGFYKVLVTDFGLQVIWDGHSCVFIRVPAMFMNYVDGLCGHLSQDQSDDFTNPDGGIEADVNTFGDKWAFGEDCLPCTPETCLTGDPCDDADAAAVADRVCSALTDAETPFAACFSVLDAKRTELLRDCRYDTCADPEDEEASCGYLQQYADACREAGVNVNGWREAIPICAIECGEFMRYSDCGSACPATCINPLASEECDRPCVQGCQCLPGLVLSGDKCVAIEECGCTDAGKYYTNGQQFIVPDCNSTCVCTSGKLTCTDMTCDENAVCALQNGVRGCYCRGYYEGDGISCTAPCDQDQHPCRNGAQCVDADNDDGFICRCPEGRTGPRCDQDLLLCRASGDPHYVNFDGEKFDFQGGCEYVLAQSCNENITDFKVLVDNNPSRWNPRVALTKTVTVEVYNQKIVLDQGKVVRINDDGVATIPVNDPNFSIYMSGSYVVIKTDFNLKVEWNGYTTVKVKVPVEFAGNLCGLCGNGNGGNGDDMVTRDGQAESNINHWGHSWATNADICDICEDCLTEDACDTADVDIVENANDYCNIITATTGVFGPTGEVNPGPIEPVVPVPAAPVIPKEGKRELSYIKRSVPDTFLLQARDISEESHQDIQSEVSISGDRREHERQRRKRQSSPGTVYASGITVRWSATGLRPGQRDPLVVNTTIRYYELSDDISGTGLWKLSMYGSANSDGTGDKFQHTEQILSEAQQALPLEGHADIMFVESEGTLDILSLGCEMEFRYLCFDFTRGDNPNPDYTFVSFQVPATKLTLCSDRCFQPPEPPPVTVTGLEVRIGHYGIRADVKDAFTANTTVHFASTSPDVIGNGLWKLSIYGSKTPDGTLDHYQHIDQVLTASQQAQSLIGGADIVFIGSEGEINIHGLGCGEFQYLCVDFMKEEDPSVDFTFETLQAQSDKFTVCILIPCQEDMDIDISGGFVLVTDLTGAIRISALDQLAFQEIPLEGLAVPVAVDYDPVDQMLYWTDVNLKTISRAYLDGTGQETVLNLGSGSIADGMTLDVQRRVMYWTDTGYDRIERSNLDGSARTIIFDMDSQEPRAIVVDSNNGVLYWTDWGNAPKIERGKVDGSERVVLVDTDLKWPNGLAIDFLGGRIYWADAGLNKIESTDLVGNDRKLLLSTGSNVDLHPFDIGIYQDTILWSDWNFTRVLTMDKNTPGRAALTGNAVFARAGGLHIQYGGCTDEDGNFTPEGQTSGDPCMPCMCLNKKSSCYVIDCAPPPEELPGQKCTPIVVQGECCPTYRCRQIESPPCIDADGTEVPEGETVGDACSPCTCTGGELLCLAYQCVPTEPPLGSDCKLVIIEGDCCPTWSCQAGDGPFINCHGVIDPAEFFNDCRFDWCATESNEQFCEDVAAYAEACQQQGIPIGPWRDAVGCALECPTYSHYEVCPSACQQTCADLNAETEVCAFFCHEGCVCDDGYILEGNKCIPAVACGCVDNDGRYHRQGATVITETCDQQCVCESAGDGWNCAALPGCGSNSECVIRDSERRCYCKDGYVLQGEDCARGCLWGGDFIQYSTRRFADRTCSTGCYCDELTELVCTDISCHSDALCVADPASSLYQCQCPEGYIGDGVSFCAPLIPPGFP